MNDSNKYDLARHLRILVFGSCVSRDIFNYVKDEIELDDYFARSSFASAFSPSDVKDIYTDKIQSVFQRRMVASDLKKTFEKYLKSARIDILLIDFIDERFSIFKFDDGGVCTLSSELNSSGFDPERELGRLIPSGCDEFYDLWEKGWVRFLNVIDSISCRDKIRINRVLWAKSTSTGRDFPTHSKQYILAANQFLQRLYTRIENDLQPWQFIEVSPGHCIAAENHRWGLSPFHYVDAYYTEALLKIVASLKNRQEQAVVTASGSALGARELSDSSAIDHESYPFDRSLVSWQRYTSIGYAGDLRISDCRTLGNCVVKHDEQFSRFFFGADSRTHQVSFILPKCNFYNGIAARVRLHKWSSIQYLALGYTHANEFRHIKIVNPVQRQWLTVSLVHGDIAYGIQNDWSHPAPAEIADIRIYLRAEPLKGGGEVEVEHFICWEEADRPTDAGATCTLPLALPAPMTFSPDLLHVLYSYLRKCFTHVEKQAEEFMQTGRCPPYGGRQLDWRLDRKTPDNLATFGTHAFAWHALQVASILMVYAKSSGKDAPVFAAREMVTNWLDHSYYTPEPDKKRAWHDKCTAERQMAFIVMWAEGVERGFDQRFMSRLGGAIVRHAELLESEQFYASHQPTRYHNHAWFQDLALMATALAMPDVPASRRWMRRAIERLTDQLETLIVRDNGFAIFVENSIGYHQGVQRIVELAGDMVRLTGVESSIPDVAVELSRFSDFFRYPDNRAPAQGDTFRRSNPEGDEIRKLKPYPEPEVVILPKAGYGIVKGNHEGARFMFCMFATSLCRTHKHEDDLSFTLFFDGIEWLIDPSFYSHEYKSRIPAYLRSAAAHNGIYIADRPYSIDPGHSALEGLASGDVFEFKGEHRCYPDVIVKRRVSGRRDLLSFEFEDEVCTSTNERLEVRLMLHCGEGVEVSRSGRVLTLTHPDSRYQLSILMPGDEIAIVKGMAQGDRIRGVSGTAFMQRSDIHTIEALVPCNVPLRWALAAQQN